MTVMRISPLLLVALACFPGPTERDATDEIVLRGAWRTDTFTSQLGQSTSAYCFDGHGHFSSWFRSDAGTFEDRGTYSIDRTQLTITGTNGTFRYAIERTAPDTLILRGNDDNREYKRVAATCKRLE